MADVASLMVMRADYPAVRSDGSAQPGARLPRTGTAEVATDEETFGDPIEEDDSFNWFVNLLVAEIASEARVQHQGLGPDRSDRIAHRASPSAARL